MKFMVSKSSLGPVADSFSDFAAFQWPFLLTRSRGLSTWSLGHLYGQLTALFWHSAGGLSGAKARAHPRTFQGPAWNIKTHSRLATYQSMWQGWWSHLFPHILAPLCAWIAGKMTNANEQRMHGQMTNLLSAAEMHAMFCSRLHYMPFTK